MMLPPPLPSPSNGASLAVVPGATAAPSAARKGETKTRDEPPAKTVEKPPTIEPDLPSDDRRTIHPPTKGAKKRRKCPLPSFKDHSWEGKADGSWESWHAPAKARKREERVYLGRVGKKLLANWLALPVTQRRKVAGAWIEAKRKGKGIG